jgi:hypothetical protein
MSIRKVPWLLWTISFLAGCAVGSVFWKCVFSIAGVE